MKTDAFSNPIFQEQDLFDIMYAGNIDCIPNLIIEPTTAVTQFIGLANIQPKLSDTIDYSMSTAEFDRTAQASWFLPKEYLAFDVEQYCLDRCSTDQERSRVSTEITEFKKRSMIPVLQTLKYVVDTLRENNILWGVGRGSSVSSYVLFLLGVHKIDSIRFNLDWSEFLR